MSIALTTKNLIKHFGAKSSVSQAIVPQLVNILENDVQAFLNWCDDFVPPRNFTTSKLAKIYNLPNAEPYQMLFAVQSYYALVVQSVAAFKLGMPDDVVDVLTGDFFVQHNIRNMREDGIEAWYLPQVDMSAAFEIASQLDYGNAPPDALKGLYHDLLPRKLRHALGEYYTPDWFAEFVLQGIYDGEGRLLDPTCGSGTFLMLALQQMAHVENPLGKIVGIDVNPLACLAAKANLILALGKPDTLTELPIYCADVLLNPPDIGEVDVIVGNPPWVNWETLPQVYRDATRPLWEQYGLFAHSGMDTILGKGKKDLSLLITNAVMDRYLRYGGILAFVLTQATLKTSGAAGFRKFSQGHPITVDDFSGVQVFKGVNTHTIVMVLEKGKQADYPVPYALWKHQNGRSVSDSATRKQAQKQLICADWLAEPMGDLGSAWLTGKQGALNGVRKLLGQSAYHAHAGVYTGGANAVYWLEILGHEGDLLRVRNIIKGAKRKVKQVEALIEPDFVYPLLRGKDVRRWDAEPTAHIIVVQNPETKIGYGVDYMGAHAPRTYAYLAQFEGALRQRATYKRYFKGHDPFYTMFDVGHYTFAPVKVTWQGFGVGEMRAAVITTEGNKPIMTNQAMHPFIGLDDEDEAHYLCALLNSVLFEYAVMCHTQPRGKSFAQAGVLERLRLPKYERDNALHQQLSNLSWQSHKGVIDTESLVRLAADLWQLTHSEVLAIRGTHQYLTL